MKKIIFLSALSLLIVGSVASAQGEMNAYKYSQSELSGTARYLGMGGAFGALGGDISAMTSNPGGLAIYRSSEVLTTLSLSTINTKTNWLGTTVKDNQTKFNFDNIAYVGYFPTSNDTGILSWNVGFSYNRMKNYSRNYRMSSRNMENSLSDYIADITNLHNPAVSGNDLGAAEGYDAYSKGYNWLSILAYQGGIIDSENPSKTGGFFSPFGSENASGEWIPDQIDNANLDVSERGAIDKYDFSFATNISDRVFLGATFSVTDMDYRLSTSYTEVFNPIGDFYLRNNLKTTGTGYGFNIGAIVRPTDFLRLGVAYNSPTWYKLTSNYEGFAQTSIGDNYNFKGNTPGGAYSNFELRSPERWIFSAAAILGQNALLSVDYQITNYKSMSLADDRGMELTADNDDIRNHFEWEKTLKAGLEIKVTPQFAVRAGGAWVTSPMTTHLQNVDNVDVFTAGTVTNFTTEKNTSYYTVGLGYRFTPNFYTDVACVFKTQKENAFAFPKTFDKNGTYVNSIPASLKTQSTRVALTLGYKF